MSTRTLSAPISLGSVGSPATRPSFLKRVRDRFVAARMQEMERRLVAMDPRLAAELRVMRDRQEG